MGAGWETEFSGGGSELSPRIVEIAEGRLRNADGRRTADDADFPDGE